MTSDIAAIVRKEWLLFLRVEEGRIAGPSRILLLIAAGTLVARHLGTSFGTSYTTVAVTAFLATLSVLPVVVESFAGERERRTLETLLMTPSTDRAILAGKLLALSSYGAAISLGTLGVGLATTGLRNWVNGAAAGVDPLIVLLSVVYALLAAALTTLVGMHVSLHAASVRRALQSLGAVVFALVVGPMLVLRSLSGSLPARLAASIDLRTALGAGVLCGALVCAGLFVAATVRFRRQRLVLD